MNDWGSYPFGSHKKDHGDVLACGMNSLVRTVQYLQWFVLL